MEKKNGCIVNKIIAVNCSFEVSVKGADNDGSHKNKESCGRTVSLELLQMHCACPERCFAKRKAKPSSSLSPAEGAFHSQFLKALASLSFGISE